MTDKPEEKKVYSGWVNVYKMKTATGSEFQIGPVYTTEEEAKSYSSHKGHLATMQISFRANDREALHCLISKCPLTFKQRKVPFISCILGFLVLNSLLEKEERWIHWGITLYFVCSVIFLVSVLLRNFLTDLCESHKKHQEETAQEE